MEKYSFKGSAIDRNFSYAKIDCQIKINNSLAEKETAKQELQKSSSTQPKSQNPMIAIANYFNINGVPSLKYTKLFHWDEEDEENEEIKKR